MPRGAVKGDPPQSPNFPAGIGLNAGVAAVAFEPVGNVAGFADVDPIRSGAATVGDPEQVNAADAAWDGSGGEQAVEPTWRAVGAATPVEL